ncbi:MAG TPA: DsbA family protein [Candidatus Paceibacterota bacterium]
MEQNQKSNSLLAVSIFAAAIIIGGALIYSSTGDKGSREGLTAQVADAGSGAANNVNPTIDDDVILGDLNAPVTLIEFGDYQCPYCRKMFDETEKRLRDEYVKSGKLRIVYRDFPLDQLHPYARSAAEASECARDQGKYWIYHDMLFERQAQIPSMNFVSEAAKLSLNSDQFKTCYEGRKYRAEVEKDHEDGLAVGVTGTPSNFINGKPYPGALPYETFKAAIDEALQNFSE